ncbi:MAG: hypothetical protein RLZZ15_1734 [Verrucomicrobiota bacterium]
MTFRPAKILRALACAVAALALLAAAAGAWFYTQLRASLPLLDGRAAVPGLAAPVTITRDALGVPTISGAARADVLRALGFLHAQERFFQMDLQRRHAAGELAELVGPAAVPVDRRARLHGFRRLAAQGYARATPEEKILVDAYAAGVNAGLAALRRAPFEYLALRSTPQPWLPGDCLLVNYAMFLDLQGGTVATERSLAALRDTLGEAALEFFAPSATPGDAALDGTTAPLAPMPTAKQLDLRKRITRLDARAGNALVRADAPASAPVLATPPAQSPWFPARDPEVFPGSNNFALAGTRTATGAALLANDMHLDHALPNTWYRAALEWDGPAGRQRSVGVTLPGVPGLIAGSNGRVAWGFTDAYADTGDLVIVVPNSIWPAVYRSGDKDLEIENRPETIRVRGGAPVEITVPWTIWGPIVGHTGKRPLAYRWLAHDPEASDFGLLQMETAPDLDAAIAIAHRAGIPAENCLLAAADGTIAWTIAGRLPRRVGFDGRLPVQWTYGDRRWDGLLPPDEVPVIKSPATGQLWTANNRVLGGPAGALLGDAGASAPARAAQIRDALTPLARATPKDLLAVQLDDRAVFLGWWQQHLLATLTPAALAQKKSRAELRALVEKWDGRAAVDSVGYRLVRAFREHAADLALAPIFAPCTEAYEEFAWRGFHYEDALRALLREKPPHLLDPRHANWDALALAAADQIVTDLARAGTPLAEATWGRRNTAKIRHPLARVLPGWLTFWLNAPADPLPGDRHMPRVQTPGHGASQRLVVSPGREAEGIFHMPGGQSGHPLSPHYLAGHAAWVRGEPTPLLPGETKHTLTLAP